MKYCVRKTVSVVRLETSRVTCDICGAELNRRSWHDMTEIEIRAHIGNVWPEGDCRDSEGLDCCLLCWRTKVRPAIEALGGKFREWATEDGEPKNVVETEPSK